jgi:hypothetical protein
VSDHPGHGDLEGLVYGDLSRERNRALVRHLLHGCAGCGIEMVRRGGLLLLPMETSQAPPGPLLGQLYDTAIERATVRAMAPLRRSRIEPAA